MRDLKFVSSPSLKFDSGVKKILAILGVSTMILKVEVKKAFDCSLLLSMTRHH